MSKELKLDFFWTDNERQFLFSSANLDCSRSTLII